MILLSGSQGKLEEKTVWLEAEATGPLESCQWLCHRNGRRHARHDDHGHIIFSPSAQRLLD